MDEEAIQCLRKQGNIFGLPEDPSLVPDRGLGEIYFDKMKENAENIAQIDAASGKKETYAQVLSRAIRVAQGLKAKGITEDDVVALCTFNSMESAIPILSCLFLNVKSVNLDPRIPLKRVTDPKRLRGGVRIIESIPKTPSFKLRRRDLRNMVLQGVL